MESVVGLIVFLARATVVLLCLCVTILPLLAFFKATRRASAVGYWVSSYTAGLYLWLYCAIVVYTYTGIWGVVIGVAMFGVGVFPMAIVMLGWKAEWGMAGQFVAVGAVVWVIRAVATALSVKVGLDQAAKRYS